MNRFGNSDESTAMSTGAEVVMQRYICAQEKSWEPLTKEKLQEAFLNTMKTSPSEKQLPGSHTANNAGIHADSLQHTDTEVSSQHHISIDTTSEVQTEKAMSNTQVEQLLLQEQFHALRKSVEKGLEESEDATKQGDGMILKKVRMIHLIDSGGQPAFFDIHPVIATSPAVYLLVYNMEEGLEAKPKITYRKKDLGFTVKDMPNAMQSNLDMITGSLLTLQHCKQKFGRLEEIRDHWFKKAISQYNDAVPVLVIGTRKQEKSIASENKKLLGACSHLPSWKEVLPCTHTGTRLFPVNSKDPNCKGVKALRDVITEAKCTYQLHLPTSWLYCQLIFWSAAENLQTLPYSTLNNLCQREGLISSDRECLAMVRTFHLLGIFSFPYFDQEQTLGDQWNPNSKPVFTNPDVLYRQATKVLEVAFCHLERTKMTNDKWKSLYNLQIDGLLSVDTLHHLSIPDQLGSYSGFHLYLLEQLDHWGLASEVSQGKVRDRIEYFIPSVFPPCNQPFDVTDKCPIPVLAFTFKHEPTDEMPFCCVPLGIFPHLIMKIRTGKLGYEIKGNTDTCKCLFRDSAIFGITPSSRLTLEHSYSVRLTGSMDRISILIHPSHNNKMRKSEHDCHQIINDIQSAMEYAYKQIYHTHHPVTLACSCPCSWTNSKAHLSAILPRASAPDGYIQTCLLPEDSDWEQDCPKDIAAIMNQGR